MDFIPVGEKITVGIESMIIELTSIGFRILRTGIVTKEDLESVIPVDETSLPDKLSPGMLKFITVRQKYW